MRNRIKLSSLGLGSANAYICKAFGSTTFAFLGTYLISSAGFQAKRLLFTSNSIAIVQFRSY